MTIRVKYSDYVNGFNRNGKTSNYDAETKMVDVTVDDLYEGKTEMLIRGLESAEKYAEICEKEAGVKMSIEDAKAQIEGIKDALNKAYGWKLETGKKYIA